MASTTPFRRVAMETEVDPRVADNSFEAKAGSRGAWGERANHDLKFTKGQRSNPVHWAMDCWIGNAVQNLSSSFSLHPNIIVHVKNVVSLFSSPSTSSQKVRKCGGHRFLPNTCEFLPLLLRSCLSLQRCCWKMMLLS